LSVTDKIQYKKHTDFLKEQQSEAEKQKKTDSDTEAFKKLPHHIRVFINSYSAIMSNGGDARDILDNFLAFENAMLNQELLENDPTSESGHVRFSQDLNKMNYGESCAYRNGYYAGLQKLRHIRKEAFSSVKVSKQEMPQEALNEDEN